ncbi:hypothetical protein Tco_1438547 [Tanacetum coccineum]
MKGVGLRVVDSHTVDPFRARRGGLRAELEGTSSSSLVKCDLVIDYGIPRDVRAMLLKKNQIVFDSPLSFVGLYTHSFTLSNLRIPLPKFFCEVLNYFKVHISCFNPFGLPKLTTFVVMCKAYGGEPSVDLLRAFLNLGPTGNWLTLSNRGGANGGDSPSVFVNNETPATYVEPLNIVAPSQFAKNTADSYDTPLEKDEVVLIDRLVAKKVKNRKVSASSKVAGKRKQTASASSGKEARQKIRKVLPQASKAAGQPSDPLYVDSDLDIHEFPSAKELRDFANCHWVVAHVTPPLWKHHLNDISLDKLCDIHDKAYMRQVVLDNVMNRRTHLDKNHLVLDLLVEIKSLQREVDKLHGEYSRLMGLLVARLVKMDLVHGRCTTFEEVVALKEPFELENMHGYFPFPKNEFDQAGDNATTASYPFLVEAIADPYAP